MDTGDVGRSPRRKTDATRRRLIEGTVDILRREGIEAATTARIASAAGLKQPTFYVHFANRNEVFEAAAAQIAQRMVDKVARQHAHFDQTNPRSSLRLVYGNLISAFLAEPDIARIFLKHRTDDGTALGRMFAGHVNRARAAILDSLHLYGVTAPRARCELYVEIVVSAFFTMLEGLLSGRLSGREDAVEALADVTASVFRSTRSKWK